MIKTIPTAVCALLLANIINLTPCLLRTPGNACLAVEQVEEVAENIYRLAYVRQIPGMTEEQFNKIRSIYSAYKEKKDSLDAQVKALNGQLLEGFAEPMPSVTASVAKEDDVNKLANELDVAAIEAGYQIHQCLNQQQLQAIYGSDLNDLFRGVKLSDEQNKQMLPIVEATTVEKSKLSKHLSQLQYDKLLIMKRADVDEKVLFDKQNEINAVEGQLANEDLKMQMKLRAQLTQWQRNELYNTHRGNVFGALGLSGQQNQKVMDMHMRREDVSTVARRQVIDLGSDLLAAYRRADTDKKTLSFYQEEIDKIADQARIKETMYVLEFRKILTPAQREKMSTLLKLQRQGKMPPLPYPDETCPMHLHPAS